VKQILNLEYIEMEMDKLIKDNWEQDNPEPHCCGRPKPKIFK